MTDKVELEIMPQMFDENTDEQGFYKVQQFTIEHRGVEGDAV